MRRTSEIENQSRRRANRRPPGPGSPESRERGNASAGEGRIGCAMTRATRIAAAHAAGGRVRSTETATVPHAGTTPSVLSPRSPTSRSLASSEGSSPYEPGQSGRGRQHRDHQRRTTSLGRRTTKHRIVRRRRRSRGAVIGRRGNLDRNRRPQASPQPRRPRTQPERLRRGRQRRQRVAPGPRTGPRPLIGNLPVATSDDGSAPAPRPRPARTPRTTTKADRPPRPTRPPRPARPQSPSDDDRRSGIVRDTDIRGWRIRVAHRCSEATSPSRRTRTWRERKWRPRRGHHRLAVERPGSRERRRERRRTRRRRTRPEPHPKSRRPTEPHAYRVAHVRREAASPARHRRRSG